jgi:hypothetical protein
MLAWVILYYLVEMLELLIPSVMLLQRASRPLVNVVNGFLPFFFSNISCPLGLMKVRWDFHVLPTRVSLAIFKDYDHALDFYIFLHTQALIPIIQPFRTSKIAYCSSDRPYNHHPAQSPHHQPRLT